MKEDTHFLEESMEQDIFKHRNVHFRGNFKAMLDYYRDGGKGIHPDIEISRLEELTFKEIEEGRDLAKDFLTAADFEEIKKAQEAYEKLRKIYSAKAAKNPFPKLIASLILSEEVEPEQDILAIVDQKSAIVPYLIDLLKTEEMYNPLYPGYGQAPFLAARCLGLIGDKRALIALFELIGQGDFFDDELAINAIKAIGEPAKQFLLKVLRAKPINEDNERAAIALIPFKDDPEVSKACFAMLKELDLKKDAFLATYLILACEKLKNLPEQKDFEDFAKKNSIPRELKNDFESIFHIWQAT